MLWVVMALVTVAVLYSPLAHTVHDTRARAAAKAALRALAAGEADPFAPVRRLSGSARRLALNQLHYRLHSEDRWDEARQVLRLGAELEPEEFFTAAVDLALEEGDNARAEAICARLLAAQPNHVAARRILAELWLEGGRTQEALDLLERYGRSEPDLAVAYARALAGLGRQREALQLLDQILPALEQTMRTTWSTEEHHYNARFYQEASLLADALRSELLGAESVILAAAQAGNLAPRAGVNHRMLGQAMMARSGRIARELTLQPVDLDEDLAAERRSPRNPPALCRAGCALLREGDPGEALERFERARDLDGDFFPAELGFGAARTLLQHRAIPALADLPREDVGPEWAAVLPDLPALTPRERRVVAASAAPLSGLAARLAEAGIIARILPLDVRPTDLEEIAALDGLRTGDTRAIRGLGGLATDQIALSRVEDLLDTVSPNGWVFAHELAHVAFHVLPDPWRSEVEALYARALEVPYSCGQYQLSNIDEFFAVSYADFLRDRYGRAGAPRRDDEGVVESILAFFARLEAASPR